MHTFADAIPSHAMFVDQKDESCYVPLNDSLKAPGRLELANSKSRLRAMRTTVVGANGRAQAR
jgi:hypothetical protein